MHNCARVGVAGDQGSFSEKAAQYYWRNQLDTIELVYLLDMQTVLHAVHQGSIDYGVLPLYNYYAGVVEESLHAMAKYLFTFINHFSLPIEHALLTQAPNSVITEIASHQQALRQCQQYLQKHYPNAQQTAWIDTAQAARDLHNGKLSSSTAVIASDTVVNHYALHILDKNIQDEKNNRTEFIVVSNASDKTLGGDASLQALRQGINRIDEAIIHALAKRSQLSQAIGQIKQQHNQAIYDLQREEELAKQHKQLAHTLSIDEDYIEQLFRIIKDHSRQLQKMS